MLRRSFFVSQPKAVTSKCRTMVLGHSFVARLGQFASTNRSYTVDPNFGFSESELDVHVVGVGGRTVAKVRMFDLGAVDRFQPHTIQLELGTNDLASTRTSPIAVAHDIKSLVCDLHQQYGVMFVTVGQAAKCVESRTLRGFKGLAVEAFNQRVIEFNAELEACLQPLSYAKYWRHRSVWRSPYELMVSDGLHFNDLGNYRLYKSVKSALVIARKRNPYFLV